MKDDAIIINSISEYVYQSILVTLEQHPQWLSDKFKNYPWQNMAFKAQFTNKLGIKLSEAQNRDALVTKLITLLQSFLAPAFFVSYQFTDLIVNIRKYTHPGLEIEAQHLETLNRHHPFLYSRLNQLDAAFAILLLDAENLSLDSKSEKIMGKICTYPINIKLAFANWRRLGKKDLDLHNRGYELIHVPAGKNSADLKMSSLGSSIWVNYPAAKEVLICSSDADFNHLCTTLQNHGLTVYRISRRGNEIVVFNSETEKTDIYSLIQLPTIPSLENFITQIKEIIKSEQALTKNIWIELTRVSQLFQEKYQLTLTQVLEHHFPGQKNTVVFLELNQDFVVHQLADSSQLYITLFDVNLSQEKPTETNSTPPEPTRVNINSQAGLEAALVRIVQCLTAQSHQEYVCIITVASMFQAEYGVAITKAMRRLELNSKYTQFLQSCNQLKVKKLDKNYLVGLEY
ncbi:MAG: NYN domain-containing protein [Gomphosphaeria aponina SAG 52.96 = DSM 107014]|uniref:NYN domain-containing protein n=1 Tax=Gomphosphaeria aponina SAG 52.96 = DSM 107014 TaxID=1521640 RepID=A0A941GXW5_9CHRO|nr:NYN domain-containing protein [Gomphosphaeria aponina SAG 52.96 = DSM 107014]